MSKFKSLAFVFGLYLLGEPGFEVRAQQALEDQLSLFDRDDIHSIHKRLYTKDNRHEFSLQMGGILNNGGLALVAAQYTYHFFEALGLEAAAGGYGFEFGDDQKLFFYQASLVFSPIYGKISWFTWAVLNFDLYTAVGGGVVSYDDNFDGTSFMGNAGIGFRTFINEYLAARIEFRDYLFEKKTSPTSSKISHNYTLTAGVSLFFPFRQEQ